MIKIDKDIPISVTKKRTRPHKYPFVEMKIGDSFFIEAATIQQVAQKRSALCISSKKMGIIIKLRLRK